MNGEIILTQPSGYILLCILGGALLAALLYWGDKEVPRKHRIPLAFLRGLAFATLAFLLLGPLLRSIDTRTQKPTFVIAEDRSTSISGNVADLSPALLALEEKLSDKYDVQRLSFGEFVRPSGDTIVDAATDISELFTYTADQYPPELLGGILLASDGIYNKGNDPIYAAAKLASPVYTIRLGDTTPTRDVAVRDVLYNRIAYLGDRLELQSDISSINLNGSSSSVSLFSIAASGKSQLLATERVDFSRSRDFATRRFEIELKKAGVQHFRITASGPQDEQNKANNSRDLYIDVLDGRQQILILAAAPHPDISALRQALDENKNYETEFELAANFTGSLTETDLVIFHNLPDNSRDISDILRKIDERKIGRLFIAGPGVNSSGLNSVQKLTAITSKGGSGNSVSPKLNGNFRLFTIPENWAQTIKAFPPANAPFADYGPLTSGEMLLTQRIGRVDTDFPLLAMGELNGIKTGLLNAQDIWRWRLGEFQQTETHEVFDGLILATVQYLALKEDKRPFRVSTAEKVYTTSDDVRLQAELYNASFQLVNEPDVNVRITDAEGTDYTFLMDKAGSSYLLRAGRLPQGSYTFRATTSYDGQAYKADGGFTVREVQLESLATTADWGLLQRLSQQQGGESILPADINTLADNLLATDSAKPVLYQSVKTRPLIDWPWLLAIVLSLLAIEWFVRRRIGTY